MRSSGSRWRRTADISLVLFFLAALGLPVARNVAAPARVVESEYRVPAAMPELKLKSGAIRGFPDRFDSFFNDHFGFRDTLIRLLSMAKLYALGVSPSVKVTVGKRGWLFSSEFPGGADHNAARPFTADELDRWRRLLEKRRDWLAERGIRYLFVIAPNKQSVYPEFLPEALRRQQNAGCRIDQLVTHMRQHSDVQVLDLRPALQDAKKHERVYDRTDTHWNDRGAYAGYRALVSALQPDFPALSPRTRDAWEDTSDLRQGGDLARMMDLDGSLTENALGLKWKVAPVVTGEVLPAIHTGPQDFVLECPHSHLPRAVLFCDSFAVRLAPFLSDQFERIVFKWQMVFPTFESELINAEKPDLVIQEMVERKLVLPVPEASYTDPLVSDSEAWSALLRR
jgi:hypothetical protein